MKNKPGWNDIAHGILTWTPHDQWQSPLEWALHCKAIAVECLKTASNTAYYQNVIAAVNQYQQTGRIAKV